MAYDRNIMDLEIIEHIRNKAELTNKLSRAEVMILLKEACYQMDKINEILEGIITKGLAMNNVKYDVVGGL